MTLIWEKSAARELRCGRIVLRPGRKSDELLCFALRWTKCIPKCNAASAMSSFLPGTLS